MLKDKTERLELRGKIIKFYWIPGHCGIEVNKRADMETKYSIKEGRDSQLLLPVADLKAQWKKKGKEELHSFCQNTRRDRGESYFKRYVLEEWLGSVVPRDQNEPSCLHVNKPYESRPHQS
jgi:hypothetical protein